MNKLYFGDNLDVTRKYVEPGSVDLIYLDPPFNSNARYNVLFKSPREDVSSAQVGAFLDFWIWGYEAERAYEHLLTRVGGETGAIVRALRAALGDSDMMAYLVMMAIRLVELHRALKPTGCMYLHCDPTASHYLKIILDAIFGVANYRNEVTWRRSRNPKGSQHQAKRYSPDTDSILFYAKSDDAVLRIERIKRPLSKEELLEKYDRVDNLGSFTDGPVVRSPSMGARENLSYVYKDYDPSPWGWRMEEDKLAAIDMRGDLGWTSNGKPYRKLRMDDDTGAPVGNCWTDISSLNPQSAERIGYPTQKPLALLERIIKASSNEGDLVLDPFCGCGTTVHASETLGRRWIGIDVSIHAIHVIEERLGEHFGALRVPRSIGIPADYETAADLAKNDPFQFQWWANYLLGVHLLKEVKKGADRGIDGELFFPNGPGRSYGRLLTSVKAGKNVNPAMVREFRGVIEREQAEMGLFICLNAPTREMLKEAVVAGFAKTVHGSIPRIQIMAIDEWFQNQRPQLPPIETLPYAAFSKPSRTGTGKRPDPNAPELPLVFTKELPQAGQNVHLNPRVVRGSLRPTPAASSQPISAKLGG
ncbi:DNA methyltransferase [Mesorhizobium sp. M0923]|uniref:DNA methyltransferase n=2 Tax=Mesorhizobium TaxID=68287 RepID=UPI003338FF71